MVDEEEDVPTINIRVNFPKEDREYGSIKHSGRRTQALNEFGTE